MLFVIIYLKENQYIILGEFSGYHLFKTYYKVDNAGNYIYFRNIFLFRSLPYFMIGMFIRINNIKIKLSLKKYLFIFIIGSICSCIEYSFINKSLNAYISTLIQLFSLIGLSTSDYKINNIFLIYIGKHLSLKIYIYHIAIKKIVDLIFLRLKLNNCYSFQFLIILPLCLLICFMLKIIESKLKKI